MSADWNTRWAPAMRKVAQAETEHFDDLLRVAGLNPAQHLRFADWSNVDFSGCNLHGFDFTGARLLGCKFDGALIEGAQFDMAIIDRAARVDAPSSHPVTWDSSLATVDSTLVTADSTFVTADSAHLTGALQPARRTRLSAAKDWAEHLAGWRKSVPPPSDAHLSVGAVFQDAPFAPEMVVIPPGEFLMGSSPREPDPFEYEGPQRRVRISQPIAVGRFAVSFDEWDFAQADKDWRRITGVEAGKGKDEGWGRGNRPMINVNWNDARAYVKWLQVKTGHPYRLLSEAEWEYAARAGTDTPFWWGYSITPEQANYDGSHLYEGGGEEGAYRGQTVPVDLFAPNPFGLYQVHGNIWEWVEDCWNANYVGAPTDGSAWTAGDDSRRVLRGGAWFYDPSYLRAASRGKDISIIRSSYAGFRLSRKLNL